MKDKFLGRFTAFLVVVGAMLADTRAAPQCSGSASVAVVYADTQIRSVVWSGVDQVSSVAVGTPFTPSARLPLDVGESFAGESGVADYDGSNLLFPAATLNSLYTYSTVTGQWSDIDVYCKPVGVAYGHDIVGFCEVDLASPTPCVPYFKVQWIGGQYTDLPGCSHPLASTNLTNSVILSYDDQYGYSTKLYIAEQETGVFHEIDFGEQHSGRYNIPHVGDRELKVGRIVPVVAKDGSFTGVRIELFVQSSPNSIFHVLYSSTAQRFTQTNIQTETTAFDAYNLNYFVSFTANRRTMIVSFRDGTTRQYPLGATLDDPIQCENMAGADSHYLICHAENGLNPIMIDVINGTSQTIPVGESLVVKLGTLNANMFWLLNSHQELSLYLVNSSNVVLIGVYTVCSNTDFTLMNFSSNISCSFNHTTTNDTVTVSRNQTNTTYGTNNSSNETENSDEIESTNAPTNETDPTINTSSTVIADDNNEKTNTTSHPSDLGTIKESGSTGGPNDSDKTVLIVLSVVIAALIVSIGVALTVILMIIRRSCSGHLSKKLELSRKVIASIPLSKGDDSSQQHGKEALSKPVDKALDAPGSKPTSIQRSLSLTCGTYKSEKLIIYIDPDCESIKSPLPCSDGATTMAPSSGSRIGPDGTDRYTN